MSRVTKGRGFTVIELLVSLAILIVISAAAARMGAHLWKFYLRHQVESQADREGRVSIETIQRLLTNAAASTIQIQNACALHPCNLPPGTSSPPSSEITFSTAPVQGSTKYDIYWSKQAGQPAAIHLLVQGAPNQDNVLAKDVEDLSFTWDSTDAAVLVINLHIAAPLSSLLDAQGNPLELYNLNLNRTIRVLRQ